MCGRSTAYDTSAGSLGLSWLVAYEATISASIRSTRSCLRVRPRCLARCISATFRFAWRGTECPRSRCDQQTFRDDATSGVQFDCKSHLLTQCTWGATRSVWIRIAKTRKGPVRPGLAQFVLHIFSGFWQRRHWDLCLATTTYLHVFRRQIYRVRGSSGRLIRQVGRGNLAQRRRRT